MSILTWKAGVAWLLSGANQQPADGGAFCQKLNQIEIILPEGLHANTLLVRLP